MKRGFLIILFLLAYQIGFVQTISPFIHVDQFGYTPDMDKFAVISNPQVGYNSGLSYIAGSTYQVRNFVTDATVYTGSPEVWNSGNTHTQSGDQGWWFDFSSVTTPGIYYILDASTTHKSAPFEISTNPYQKVLQAAFKMFYYNRCNHTKESPYANENWTDVDNFFQDANTRDAFDQSNAATEKDMTGGWFDAGDYNKYVTFAHDPVHHLLSAYEENSSIFGDDWNIPESGDGLPDILNEVIWELEWLKKMINPDGSVHIKMGSLDYSINDNSPPSANTEPRYYAPTCSSASLAIASMFAKAALVLKNFPGYITYANELETTAELCWDVYETAFNNSALGYNCDDQTVKAGDADWTHQDQVNYGLVASIYLFDLTGDVSYNSFVSTNYGQAELISGNFITLDQSIPLDALLHYSSLTGANPTAVSSIETVTEDAITNDWGEYFKFRNNDLYRSHNPDWIYYWGSNMGKANIGNLNLILAKHSVIPDSNTSLRYKAEENLHYFHGINPQGIVYLTNMYGYGGDRCANEMFHTWFADSSVWDNALTSSMGPAPGYLTGGPNQAYTGSLSPPMGQPLQKCYLDYNDGYNDVAYEITEPAIYYQAAYVRYLANFVNTTTNSNSIDVEAIKNQITILPNPTDDFFHVRGLLQNYAVDILDASGNLLFTETPLGSDALINTSSLNPGFYFVRIHHESIGTLKVEKILKMN